MTMMIMRFHKLIQSKILWMGFLGIVVVSFVFWGAIETWNEAATRVPPRVMATLDGKDVMSDEYFAARDAVIRQIRANNEPVDDAEVETRTYARIAKLRLAEEWGIQFPEATIETYLPAYEQLYAATERGGVAEFKAMWEKHASFRDSVRKEIADNLSVIQVTESLVSSAGILPDPELNAILEARADRVQIDAAILPLSTVTNSVEVNDEQVEAYFNKYREYFQLPETRSVHVMYIPVPEANTNEVTDVLVEEYYALNAESFKRSIPPPEGSTNAVERFEIPELVEVRDEIVLRVAQAKAFEAAQNQANVYIDQVYPSSTSEGKTLPQIGEENGVNVITTPYFQPRDELDGIENPWMVILSAFRLSGVNDVSDVIPGDTHLRLVQLAGVEAPRAATFEEVKDEATRIATVHYQREALATNATNAYEQVKADLAGGGTFSNAVTKLGLEFVRLPEFSAVETGGRTPRPELLYSEAGLQPILVGTEAPALLEPVFSGSQDSQLIGYLNSRTQDFDALTMMRQEFENQSRGMLFTLSLRELNKALTKNLEIKEEE